MAGWQITDLVYHPEWFDEVVGWHHAEWLRMRDAAALTQGELAKVLHERQTLMRTHLTRDSLPSTFVAFSEENPIGTVSLIRYGADRGAGKVWLTNLYVQPAWRYRGIGHGLLAHGEAAARALALSELWLYSFDAGDYYTKRGWRWQKTAEVRGCPVEVLHKVLA